MTVIGSPACAKPAIEGRSPVTRARPVAALEQSVATDVQVGETLTVGLESEEEEGGGGQAFPDDQRL